MPAGLSLPDKQLSEFLADTLDVAAIPLSKGEEIDPGFMRNLLSWELVLCLNPLIAFIVTDDGGKREHYAFHSGSQHWGALQQMTMVSGKALLDVSKMLADTYIHNAAKAAVESLQKTQLFNAE